MTDKELNLRAGFAAFADSDRVVAVNLNTFDPLNLPEDLIKLLVQTGISFTQPLDGELAAENGTGSVEVTIQNGDIVAAAARAACELAASWVEDDDMKSWQIATGRFSR
ncbi:hypothetical protein [Caballeronia zhejiangensis]|uniref:hypothetical protein n=1 Tax=Caballeronia zhejiangensis TaxID=871203 RepID=UPI00158D4C4D|nr:hypothetical protein [Caballeronia zhejiangensis]